jgi:hypothetical protein
MSSSTPSVPSDLLSPARTEATASSPLGDIIQETTALTRRLFIQLQRRPSTLIAGIIQPLMWLILFGALFQNAPKGLFGETDNYAQFLGAGVIVFTAFAGALNAGLPVMFDREFGFLNRLLVCALSLSVFHCVGFGYLHYHPQFYSSGVYCGGWGLHEGGFTGYWWTGYHCLNCIFTGFWG